MAATLAQLQARRDQLLKQRHSGMARVMWEGKSIEFRSDREIAAALQDLDRQIKTLEGGKRVRQIRTYASKGL